MKILTLNLAHGRKLGFHQTLQGRRRIESNLNDVANVLRREKPHIVALQEADGPSVWSGRFDHVQYLANAADFPHFFRGEHVRSLKLSYGTAVLSRAPISRASSLPFQATPPTPRKGFVYCRVHWPHDPNYEIEVISVHLDFARGASRQRQIRQLIDHIGKRDVPLIVMGDFNCDLFHTHSPLHMLLHELRLNAWEPKSRQMCTFPSLDRRLDWILISPELEFVRYETMADRVSDHHGVYAVVRRKSTRHH